jgi:hypothetical protein
MFNHSRFSNSIFRKILLTLSVCAMFSILPGCGGCTLLADPGVCDDDTGLNF